jgi:hypothetical protein
MFINPETSDVDTAARFDLDRFPNFNTTSPTEADVRQVIKYGRDLLEDSARRNERLRARLDDLERSLQPEFDMDAALEETLDVFAPQARIRRGILLTLGNAGLGIEMAREDVAEAVYGSKSMNPCAFMEELMAAARNARRRMDERLTPLSLVIDKHWMRIDRRPEAKEAD